MFGRDRGERGAFRPHPMPRNLKRYYGQGDLHFITFSCFRRLPLLGSPRARDAVVQALREVRLKYEFALVGYVVMPEHVHLLMGEPKIGTPSTLVHSFKLRVSKRLRPGSRTSPASQRTPAGRDAEANLLQFWQHRFYDFNVWSAAKRREKIEYMHRNPVTRELVKDPKDWAWSSYASYSGRGIVFVGIDFVP